VKGGEKKKWGPRLRGRAGEKTENEECYDHEKKKEKSGGGSKNHNLRETRGGKEKTVKEPQSETRTP